MRCSKKAVSVGSILLIVSTMFVGCCLVSDESDAEYISYYGSQTDPLHGINIRGADLDNYCYSCTFYVAVGSSVYISAYYETDDPWIYEVKNNTFSNSISGLTLDRRGLSYISDGAAITGTVNSTGTLTVTFMGEDESDYMEHHWTIIAVQTSVNHTVHYDANGGSGAPADTVVTDSNNGNSNVALSSVAPTRSGYTFSGWYTAASGGSKVTSVSVGANATTTVYAHWTKNALSIGSVDKQYAIVGKSVTFTATCISNPPGAPVSYSVTAVQSGLTVNVDGSKIICSSSVVGTFNFKLVASSSNYTGSSTTVYVEFVPELSFTNAPTAGALNA